MADFKTISIRGRITYGIMCAESYALTKFPDRDWRPLFQVLWGISRDEVYWDEWASDVIDRLPEMVLSDDPRDYEDTDPEVLEQCRALYQGMPEAFNRILSSIVDIEEADACTIVEGYGAAALESLQDTRVAGAPHMPRPGRTAVECLPPARGLPHPGTGPRPIEADRIEARPPAARITRRVRHTSPAGPTATDRAPRRSARCTR